MARTEQSVDWLAAPRIGRILLLLGMLALPHMLAMPIWASAAVLVTGLWRWWLARRARSMPPLLLRLGLAGGLATAIGIHYGGVNGLEAGGAMLVCMTAMKLLETRSQRDCRLLVYLGYLLILAQMLRSQDIPWTLWMIAALTLNTAVLIDLQHPQGLLPWKHNLRLSGRLLAKAIPLAIIFFVLFPRIPGPLWGLPRDASGGRTGLSDSMEPGMISQLSQSDEVAFRVRFEGAAPPNRELYWRGPVLADFDGYRWKPLDDIRREPSSLMQPVGPTIRYEIQLDPHGRRYLLALDLPTGTLPPNARISPDYVLESKEAVLDARLIQLESSTRWSLGVTDGSWELSLYRRLPQNLNPRTLDLAREWSSGLPDPADYVQRVLQMFREEPYSYTLEPPLLRGFHRIDQFLFETRAGFCEHFAAAFVVLMRAAGLPARVVTGYQGADNNGSYYIVRQSDAHAWAEVWLPQRGWLRIDPTAAIAPERIELGLAAALEDDSLLPAMSRGKNFRGYWLVAARLAWDKIDAAWNRGILAFGPELQRKFLQRFGLDDLRRMLFLLIGSVALLGLLISLHLAWQNRRRPPEDPLAALRDEFLRKSGLEWEGPERSPQHMQARLQAAGLLDAEAERIVSHYGRLRYARSNPPDQQLVQGLAESIRRWKPAPKGPAD